MNASILCNRKLGQAIRQSGLLNKAILYTHYTTTVTAGHVLRNYRAGLKIQPLHSQDLCGFWCGCAFFTCKFDFLKFDAAIRCISEFAALQTTGARTTRSPMRPATQRHPRHENAGFRAQGLRNPAIYFHRSGFLGNAHFARGLTARSRLGNLAARLPPARVRLPFHGEWGLDHTLWSFLNVIVVRFCLGAILPCRRWLQQRLLGGLHAVATAGSLTASVPAQVV